MSKVAIVIPYFGSWPEWFDCFIESCKVNKGIDWILYSDCSPPSNKADNVIIHSISFAQYKQKVSKALQVPYDITAPYKLCDLKPFYGAIHKEELSKYEYWGFGDIDLIVGRLYSYLEANFLGRYEVFSTHDDRISGHLSLFYNNDKYREMAFTIPNWHDKLIADKNYGLDELFLSRKLHVGLALIGRSRNMLSRVVGKKLALKLLHKISQLLSKLLRKYTKLYFFEAYTTPHTQIPWVNNETWMEQPSEWKRSSNGCISTNDENHLEVIYLHFMNFKKNTQFLPQHCSPIWEPLDAICDRECWQKMKERTIFIDKHGIY